MHYSSSSVASFVKVARLVFPVAIWSNPVSDMIDKAFSQTRGEIMHEFSLIEYEVYSYLAHFLKSQPERPLNKYKKQLGRYLNSPDYRHIHRFRNSPACRQSHRIRRPKLNPKVLENPEVQRMDAELLVAGDRRSFDNCLTQLLEAA